MSELERIIAALKQPELDDGATSVRGPGVAARLADTADGG